MNVLRSKYFDKIFINLPENDRVKIAEFIFHVKTYGFDGLIGRNKSSDDVPTDDPNWLYKVKYVQTYRLWHYHIGIPSYPDKGLYF